MKRFIFFGTSDFAVPILGALIKNKWRPVLVITVPDKPAGRKQELKASPIKLFSKDSKIKIYQPASLKTPDVIRKIKAVKPDFFIVASYGKIIPREILDLAPKGALNIHPSLLPKYRGSSPIQAAILNNDKKTGVSIMLLDEQMDHGTILAQKEIIITKECNNYPILHNKLSKAGAELLLKTLPQWLKDIIKPKEQDHRKAVFTKIIVKEDGKINWNKSAEEIERQIRALNPWPGTYTFWNGKRIKIIEARKNGIVKKNKTISGSFIKTSNNKLLISAKKGNLLVEKLQLEGGKPITSKQFINGYSKKLF